MKSPDIQAIKTLDPNAVFSVSEVAALMGMSHNGVIHRIKNGLIRHGRSGSRYFVQGSEIQKQVMIPGEMDI